MGIEAEKACPTDGTRGDAGPIAVHGVLVSVFGLGVLIIGRSGIGKSGCALELVAHGHRLIADDVVNVEMIDDTLYGSAPDLLFGLIEVRGLGICDVRQLFDKTSAAGRCPIGLCIEFCDLGASDPRARIGTAADRFEMLGVQLPRVVFTADGSRNLRILVETAAKHHRYGVGAIESELIANHDAAVNRSAGV